MLLEQPSEGADRHTQNALWTLLRVMKDGRAIIFTTQSVLEADTVGDKIVVVHKGQTALVTNSAKELPDYLLQQQQPALDRLGETMPGRRSAASVLLTDVDERLVLAIRGWRTKYNQRARYIDKTEDQDTIKRTQHNK